MYCGRMSINSIYNMANKEYLTKEKYKELSEELEYLTKTRRKEIAEELQQTGSMGDLRENAEYQQAREEQAELEKRITQIENILKDAEIVKTPKKDEISVGSIIVVRKKGQKEKTEYKIVGAEEANTVEGKISAHSPLIVAMLGKKKGDIVSFEAPVGIMEYEIIDIK